MSDIIQVQVDDTSISVETGAIEVILVSEGIALPTLGSMAAHNMIISSDLPTDDQGSDGDVWVVVE